MKAVTSLQHAWLTVLWIVSALLMLITDYALWTVVLGNVVAVIVMVMSTFLVVVLSIVVAGLTPSERYEVYNSMPKSGKSRWIISPIMYGFFVVILYQANTLSAIMATLSAIAFLGMLYLTYKVIYVSPSNGELQ